MQLQLILKRQQLIEMILLASLYMKYRISGYFEQAIGGVELICCDRKIYVIESLHICVLY